MQFTRAIAHLFDFAPSGRKLPRPDSTEGDAAQIATGQRQSAKPKAFRPGEEVRDWAAGQPAQDWIAFKRRDGINGALLASACLAAGGKFKGDQIRAQQRAR